MAPMRPANATRNRKTPMPMMPPTTWKLETRPNHFPQAAMPIINMLTICKGTDKKRESVSPKGQKHQYEKSQNSSATNSWTYTIETVAERFGFPTYIYIHDTNDGRVTFLDIGI